MQSKWLQKYKLLSLETIDSTNSEAKRLALSDPSSNIVILSEEQTQGRGRYGRKWESPKGNLLMSILMQVSCDWMKAAELSFVIGLAVYESITSIAKKHNIQLPIYLKWPNDIFIQDNKIGGILLESLTDNNKQWLVIGLGLNIEHASNMSTSSSLSLFKINTNINEALNMIMNSFEHYKELWEKDGFSSIRALWLKHAYKLGQTVTISNINPPISGTFESINAYGAIEIRTPSGEIKTVSTGEMFFYS